MSNSDSTKDYAIRPNKEELKREIKALNKLGQELLTLTPGELVKIPLSDVMADAVREAKRLSRGALQRQLRRIASLMQREDVPSIRLELERLKQPSKQQTQELHQLENWRDQLIQGDERLLTELIDLFPDIDRQHIRQLVRNAQNEYKRNKPPKSSRALFQYLSKTKREHAELSQTSSEGEQEPEKTAAD